MEKREMICIRCPLGCTMSITENTDRTLGITGNTCNRGAEYARAEITNPVRTVTSTVRVKGGTQPVVSVKTKSDIPKGKISDCMSALKKTEVKAPVFIGDIIITDVAGTGTDIIATKQVERKQEDID